MIYLHCPRCRLAIKCVADYLILTNCPRCLARAAIAAPLFASPLNSVELHATNREMAGREFTAADRGPDEGRTD